MRGSPYVEMDVLEFERGGDVICASLALLSWTYKEEKYDPVQVCNGLLPGGSFFFCFVKSVEDVDWYGSDSWRQG